MASSDVLLIVASLHGGFNGDVPGKMIDVQIVSDTEAIYSLHTYINGGTTPTGEIERYTLTLEPLEYVPPGFPDTEPRPAPEETD
ncbi:hypothetical protein QDW38_gp19 [Microbacterium phage Lynlen]|uniref:hypothetical protein n=1 Tax=Microbacterium phage Lynlen TaxID=2725651 RepID=UPI001463E4EF|nr:hypothetical protein QDW38_gp19 [Microbacterium phage Lynlen]YP_010753515.1 hypothetical protein QDW39_gp19 [Microbacterium phage Kenzers]QJD53428.1 hypothetical protein SEA_LYNLEN_19 [Microbacterium phage Lynlen]UVT31648.1 hypothetical protein SEA_KENZERS_19 [Microbacterium phage Kenzers]